MMRRKVPLVLLGGCIAGLVAGFGYWGLFAWLDAEPLSDSLSAPHIRLAVLLSAVLGGALGCGSTCLGAWFSGSFVPVLWLGALAGAVTATEICILAGGIRVNALLGGANYCLGVSLLMFVIATAFCTRPRDKLLH